MLHTPLTAEQIKFQEELIYQLEIQGDMTTSDAQGVMGANEDLVMASYENGTKPDKLAEFILFN